MPPAVKELEQRVAALQEEKQAAEDRAAELEARVAELEAADDRAAELEAAEDRATKAEARVVELENGASTPVVAENVAGSGREIASEDTLLLDGDGVPRKVAKGTPVPPHLKPYDEALDVHGGDR